MAELRALCAACRKPLAGPLVASSCNHVFHRKCLASASSCGRCHQPQNLLPEEALGLYGLGFEEVDDADALALIAAIAEIDPADAGNLSSQSGDVSDDDVVIAGPAEGSSSSDLETVARATPTTSQANLSQVVDLDALGDEFDELKEPEPMTNISRDGDQTQTDQSQCAVALNPSPAAHQVSQSKVAPPSACIKLDDHKFKEVARICLLQQRKRKLQERLQELHGDQNKASELAKQQQDRLRATERAKTKHDAECNALVAEVNQCKERKEALTAQLNLARQRDAVLEYWEELRSKPSDEALAFLLRSVSCVSNPWKILTEVARLRDHHRTRLADRQKEAAQASQRELRARRDLEKQTKSLTDLEGKVQNQRRLLQRQPSRPEADPSSRETLGFFSPGHKRARVNDFF